MQIDDPSPLEKGDAITCGDDGEQLIANVLLAVMVSQLFSITAAKAYIDRAYALAQMLAQQSITYRPSQLSKFARLSFEVDSRIETFLVSIIDDSLIVPAFNSPNVNRNLLPQRGAIKLANIELVRFMLRLRTRRIVSVLQSLQTKMSQEGLFQTAEYLLTECLRHEIRSEEPLDRANDCFTLAHDLVGRKNYPFAALLLSNAVSALDSYLSSTHIDGHRAVVYLMKGKIGQLLKEIMQTAA